ncbi:MAG TPA: AgmX/PglI C-terminal domain-containing protein [Polyangia bacterium]|nr:AgmX/PglI C-terminal domain-containing protein [Polyangia bacterium]
MAKAFDAPSPFPQGPSLRESGRIGAMFPQGSGEIQRDDLGVPAETAIQRVAVVDRRSAGADGAGVIDEAVFDREVQARFSSAQDCRLEVARRKQVAPSAVVAEPLILRWTILPSGSVVSTAVVSSTLDDAELVDCLKKQMVSWVFTRPHGGPVSVERTFKLNLR